jgi:hypothetical protein
MSSKEEKNNIVNKRNEKNDYKLVVPTNSNSWHW